jgi:L-ascorbate metabolism protein UlaG (beta-lactamase superfamily)
MKIRLLRHAAAVLTLGEKRLLVDPMLSPAGAADPIPTKAAGRGRRNPLVDLPVSSAELSGLLFSLDGLLITHMHLDHFDDLEGKVVPRTLPVLCQPADEGRLRELGFREVHAVRATLDWQGLRLTRFEARHGGPWVSWKLMGKGSSYLVEAPGEPSLWVSGDTVWSAPVRRALALRPEVILAYCGAAQLPFGRSITMNARDLDRICRRAPQAKVVAVHMEALNHCLLTRDELRRAIAGKPYELAVRIPADGETVEL